MKKKITHLVLLLSSSVTLFAATLNVPLQYTTIQMAINAASPGDTVLVTPNATYTENIDFIGKDIVLRTPDPVSDRFTTIIDGGGMGSVIKFVNLETSAAKIEGFTVKNGTGTLHDWSYYISYTYMAGGGILCDAPRAFSSGGSYMGSAPVIDWMVVENNTAQVGGGICAWLNSKPAVSNTIIRNNTASEYGAGLSFTEAFTSNISDPISLTNLEITNNTGGNIGGSGISANFTSTVSVTNCTIADNSSPVLNTGEAFFRANGSLFMITNSICLSPNSDLIFDQGGVGAASTIDYSTVSNTNGASTVGANILFSNPLFVNQPAADYHLAGNSPCIDAGTAANAPLIDLDSVIRSAIPDMGAYEYVSTSSVAENSISRLTFYPAAASDFIYFKNVTTETTVRIFASDGKLCMMKKIKAASGNALEIKNLVAGLYTIQMLNAEGICSGKLIKLKAD